MAKIEIKVPDIGDFADVPVIGVLIDVGATVAPEDPLIELESDKATMEVPAPAGGTILSLAVSEGDSVSEGSLIGTLETAAEAPAPDTATETEAASAPSRPPASEASSPPASKPMPTGAVRKAGQPHAEYVVIGSGPGGYTSAFRAADLGLKTVLIERHAALGGVCLNVGCIPSKALLHAAKVITETDEMAEHGVRFGSPRIDLKSLRGWKDGIVGKLTAGLAGLAKGRTVEIVRGQAALTSPHSLAVTHEGRTTSLTFDQCCIATGSEPVALPFLPSNDPRVFDSTGALELQSIPKRLLIIGGGIIGLEMACVYDALGAKITVVELMDQIITGADKDIVKPLQNRISGCYEAIHLKTKVTDVVPQKTGLKVSFEGPGGAFTDRFDRVLVAVGRRPNGDVFAADRAGVAVDEQGFVPVDNQQRTNQPHIFAIGDVVGQPMLAHKAVHEGKVAAEVAAGHKRAFDARVIPSVAYTDPEVAWAGLTENEAKAADRQVGKGVFPWAASGRSLSIGRSEGMTKILFDPDTHQILGAGIVGTSAGDLIAEVALAIEMNADAADIGQTIHPHPTLSETVNFAAEMFEGTITDLIPPKRRT